MCTRVPTARYSGTSLLPVTSAPSRRLSHSPPPSNAKTHSPPARQQAPAEVYNVKQLNPDAFPSPPHSRRLTVCFVASVEDVAGALGRPLKAARDPVTSEWCVYRAPAPTGVVWERQHHLSCLFLQI